MQQSHFLVTLESALSRISHLRATHQFDWVAGRGNAPLPGSDIYRVAQDREFPRDRRAGDL